MVSTGNDVPQTIHMNGEAFVVVARDEYDRLVTLAKAAELPPLPAPDRDGNYPAVEYARASLARKIIRERVAAGLSQKELARLAGVRGETLCRIETGTRTPSLETIEKIDRVLRRALSARPKQRRKSDARNG